MRRSSYALTASQTVGPFFHDCLLCEGALINTLVTPTTAGERIRIRGRVLDGDGAAVPDAMVEIWQANSHGRYNHPADTRDLPLEPDFTGFGRAGTDEEGRYWFETVKPGALPFDGAQLQAPHICVAVFARGLLNHLYTRLYFADEPANAADPILLRVPEARRPTLIAQRAEAGESTVYTLNLVLQGQGETAFFNLIGGSA
jgi:protocatechuate 3,4-dioxygenase, alpha subunit